MTEISIAAPAKINLFLHITGRRDDGYHELETLFQFLSVCDELHFQLTDTGHVQLSNDIPGVSPQNNLIIQAAQRLLPLRHDRNQGATITLHKKIPMGGGLGGGSSDAASTLLALNKLWQLQLSIDQLAEIGLQLGADVPVFVRGKAAFAQGVGEKLIYAEPEQNWYLIVNPQVHVSTAEVFTHPDLPRRTPIVNGNPENWQQYRNDCQDLVCRLQPSVANALAWLLEYAPTRMTGTGACVFGCFPSEESANHALSELPTEFSGFVAQGLNTSPAWHQL
ncbi:4-(cytidine 5'-diphospho)-2-C-methyl-D-erythritol kinase [Aliidiomarina minuta]|uniref:4-diphosphocytidyl-2-C-methyl-D-erythritol kinase n=1 Tax=Aliidiomarina minuta TaxID=880057 RepID=A0A432W5S7_9GAMM|nr:4-(cytidine 5'-diphospho)-2-C-methyl-D-erythritol kinase [Aliidiomarina minuta]